MGAYICQFVETCRHMYFKYIQFITCQLYSNKVLLKKKLTEVKKKGICPKTYVYNTVLKVIFKEEGCSLLAEYLSRMTFS